MASVSVSHMILFIASMIIAASVAGVFTSSVDELSEAIEDQGPEVSDQVRTDIEIISDSGSSNNYDSGSQNVTLLVKNIGTNDLVPDETEIDVLINGQFQSTDSMTITLHGDGQLWSVDEVIEIEVSVDGGLDPGDHRAKVIVNGDEDVFEFKVS
jgi:flagellar protein FlaG